MKPKVTSVKLEDVKDVDGLEAMVVGVVLDVKEQSGETLTNKLTANVRMLARRAVNRHLPEGRSKAVSGVVASLLGEAKIGTPGRLQEAVLTLVENVLAKLETLPEPEPDPDTIILSKQGKMGADLDTSRRGLGSGPNPPFGRSGK